MAATLVQTSGKIRTSGTGDVSITMPSNFTAGNSAIASGCRYEGAITSLTINGTTAAVTTQSTSATVSSVWIRHVASLSGGSNSGTLDTPGTSDYNTFSIEEWSGLDIASIVDSVATAATGNSTAPSVSVNPSATGNLNYGAWVAEYGNSAIGITQPGSYTAAWAEPDSNTYQGGSGVYRTAASTGAQSITWSLTNGGNWRAVGAVFNVASGGTDATVNGQTVSATGSVVSGSVSASSSVAGQTLTVTGSVIAGSVSASASVAGQILTTTASVIAGSASGTSNATVAGQTVSVGASVIAGAATGEGSASVAGQIIVTGVSVIPGAASGTQNATVAGQTITAVGSVIAGGAFGDAPALSRLFIRNPRTPRRVIRLP